MKTTIKVINEELFNSMQVEVDTDSLKCTDNYQQTKTFAAFGTIDISTNKKPCGVSFWGEHGANDYLEDYGFILLHIED